MKLCFILETRNPPMPNKIIVDTATLLETRGARVRMIYPEQELWRLDNLTVEADLYLLKSDSELAISLAHSLERLGARVINKYDACRKLKDKTVAANILHQANIPTPVSYATGNAVQLMRILDQKPLILKPNRGYHGVGISIVEDIYTLTKIKNYPETVFAQHYLSDATKDLKIFGIGKQVFAVRKPFTKDSYKQYGTPVKLPARYEEIALECARVFDVGLYGIDLAELDNSVYVIDVNYFPGYRGVPNAAQLLCDYIWNEAKGTR